MSIISDHDATGKLLDLVRAKLVGDDRTPFDQLVYGLVQTEQWECAKALDTQLAEGYRQDGGSKYG